MSKIIRSCAGCPSVKHNQFEGEDKRQFVEHFCQKVYETIPNIHEIPSWCPITESIDEPVLKASGTTEGILKVESIEARVQHLEARHTLLEALLKDVVAAFKEFKCSFDVWNALRKGIKEGESCES